VTVECTCSCYQASLPSLSAQNPPYVSLHGQQHADASLAGAGDDVSDASHGATSTASCRFAARPETPSPLSSTQPLSLSRVALGSVCGSVYT
jgi:hypothetical protein